MHRRGRHDGKPLPAWRPPSGTLSLARSADRLVLAAVLAAVLASAGVALAAGAHHDQQGLALVAGGLLVALGAVANALVQHSAAASLQDQARHLAQVIQAFRLSEAA